MNEIYVSAEMLEAGVESLRECRRAGLNDDETIISVYLAIEAVREISASRGTGDALH